MITLEDIGIASSKKTRPTPAKKVDPSPAPERELATGSIEARALWHIWRGDPVVIVDSPPGAGKTTLITRLVELLANDAGLSVLVATPTRSAALSVARRSKQAVGDLGVDLLGTQGKENPGLVDPDSPIKITTIAGARMRRPAPGNELDVLIIDEAYQATFSDVVGAAEGFHQVVLVGDPGQIGPVITANTSLWRDREVAPNSRAPEGFSKRSDATILNLPTSYRLGPATVDAISPLYDFEFTSSRPDLRLKGFKELESIVVPQADHVAHRGTMQMAVDRAKELVGTRIRLSETGEKYRLEAENIAVVAARNEQTSMIRALMNQAGLNGATVGTADLLQGGQWAAVVAVDPLFGVHEASGHSAALGRLCVMASRHIAHLTWVAPRDWREVLRRTEGLSRDEYEVHVSVRRGLVSRARQSAH